MADRLPENPDLAVDEVKRKARRRLVGAVVLALAAAVVLPLLLEKEPRPLGDEVSVKIPPIDEGKFVNRLSPKEPAGAASKAAPAPAAEPKPAPQPPAATPAPAAADSTPPATAAPPAAKSLADAEQRVLAPPTKTPAAAPPPTDAKPRPAAPAAETATAPAAPVAVPAAPPAAPPVSAATAQPPAKDGFVVQLAAFSDDKGANALAGKLKKAGHAAYVEPVQTSHGTLWRVRVGGFATRADADAARAKLKDAGHAGIVAPATKRSG